MRFHKSTARAAGYQAQTTGTSPSTYGTFSRCGRISRFRTNSSGSANGRTGARGGRTGGHKSVMRRFRSPARHSNRFLDDAGVTLLSRCVSPRAGITLPNRVVAWPASMTRYQVMFIAAWIRVIAVCRNTLIGNGLRRT